ncbi:ANTAR domain-containing protein [Pseudonocardia sp. GCM10023141]|uniref:ANTAR domain-containing protein n=1 Tax=Pseudonocardia sp. GCM10023141 TaxID=3252653 RepID=UPI003606F38A
MSPPEERDGMPGRAFVRLADTLVDDYDVLDLLDQLVAYCAELLESDAAVIVLADARDALRVMASTSDDAEFMELMQLQNDEGPCLDCYRTAMPVSVADLDDAGIRWPRFAAAIAERGVFGSTHALPLRLRGESIGALNLFRRGTGDLSVSDRELGQALADVATIGILQERAIRRGEVVIEQLQSALNSRVIIEQAKGVVAQRFGLSMNDAFARIRHHARTTNQRLGEVARLLVERDLLPDTLIVPGSTARRRTGPTS